MCLDLISSKWCDKSINIKINELILQRAHGTAGSRVLNNICQGGV